MKDGRGREEDEKKEKEKDEGRSGQALKRSGLRRKRTKYESDVFMCDHGSTTVYVECLWHVCVRVCMNVRI
jgi:hypothetical protein